MTRQEFLELIAEKTGEDLSTIEAYGFEIEMPQHYAPPRRLRRRQRRWKPWLQPARNSGSAVASFDHSTHSCRS